MVSSPQGRHITRACTWHIAGLSTTVMDNPAIFSYLTKYLHTRDFILVTQVYSEYLSFIISAGSTWKYTPFCPLPMKPNKIIWKYSLQTLCCNSPQRSDVKSNHCCPPTPQLIFSLSWESRDEFLYLFPFRFPIYLFIWSSLQIRSDLAAKPCPWILMQYLFQVPRCLCLWIAIPKQIWCNILIRFSLLVLWPLMCDLMSNRV